MSIIKFTLIDPSTKILFVPDIDNLIKFAKGDVGISDGIKKAMISSSISSIKNVNALKSFAKIYKIELNKNPESYLKDGKVSIPSEDIKLEISEKVGLKSFEKTIIQTILETHKPYIETFLIMANSMGDIEDLISRVLLLLPSNREALKPIVNPNSLKFNLNKSKKKLKELEKISDKIPKIKTIDSNIQQAVNVKYDVISTIYSTGVKLDNVEYDIVYEDIIEEDINISVDTGTETDDEEAGRKNIVFGIFNSDGNSIDAPDWLVNSGKWLGQFEMYDNNRESNNKVNKFIKDSSKVDAGSKIDKKIDKLKKINEKAATELKNNKNKIVDSITNILSKLESNDKLNNDDSFLLQWSDKNKISIPNNLKKHIIPRVIGNESIDPNSDYNLRLIKVVPTYNVQNNNGLSVVKEYADSYGDKPNSVFEIERRKNDDNDNSVYYIIEGILSDDTKAVNPNYKKKNIVQALILVIKGVIKTIIPVLIDLLPAITDTIKLLVNPFQFYIGAITKHLSNNFEFLSKPFIEKFKALISMAPTERKSFVNKDALLKKYFVINNNGTFRFILNGAGTIGLLGHGFGFSIQNILLKPYFNKIDDNFNPPVFKCSGGEAIIDDTKAKNDIINQSETFEIISTKYSTGERIEGVDYDVIYVTEEMGKLIESGDKLADNPDTLIEALSNYQLALKIDPKNQIVKDRIKGLKEKSNVGESSMISSLLKIVTMPIDILIKILSKIFCFFESLFTDISGIPKSVAEFISFDWILNIFNITGMLKVMGIDIDIVSLTTWVTGHASFPDNFQFDLSKVIKIAFLPPLPTYTKEQFATQIGKPMKYITSIFVLVFEFINSYIEMIMSHIMSLDAIKGFKIPKIKIPRKDGVSLVDITNILKASDGINSEFIFDIELPDGTKLNSLKTDDLEKWISENKDIAIDFR